MISGSLIPLKLINIIRNQRSNCQHLLDHQKSKRLPVKHLILIYWLHESLWLCGSQQTGKFLKEMGIPYHLTCLLRNIHASQEVTIRTEHGMTDWFQIRKGAHQASILSPCIFNLYAEYIMWNARIEKGQAGIKIARKISITSDMQMTSPLWQKAKRN